MVELTTSPSGLFHQGFHLSVSHRRGRKTANSTASILSPCNNVIDVSSQQHGWIASPRHWFPHNLNCTWSLTTNSSQQIWIEVHSSKPKKIVGKNHVRPYFNRYPRARVCLCVCLCAWSNCFIRTCPVLEDQFGPHRLHRLYMSNRELIWLSSIDVFPLLKSVPQNRQR